MSTIRIFNNTKFQNITTEELLSDVIHLLSGIDNNLIESIAVEDHRVIVYGIDCVLLDHDLGNPLRVHGEIRWFDESSGQGVIRLDSGKSCHFFSCNVIGSNSPYPELVSNVQFSKGDRVSGDISMDPHTFRAVGLIGVRPRAPKTNPKCVSLAIARDLVVGITNAELDSEQQAIVSKLESRLGGHILSVSPYSDETDFRKCDALGLLSDCLFCQVLIAPFSSGVAS